MDREKKIAEIRGAAEKPYWNVFDDARSIANAPEWLRFLLDELEQTRKESNMLREELHKFQELAIKAANHHKAERDKLIEGLRPLMRDLAKMAVKPSNARAFPSYRKMRNILHEIGVTVE